MGTKNIFSIAQQQHAQNRMVIRVCMRPVHNDVTQKDEDPG